MAPRIYGFRKGNTMKRHALNTLITLTVLYAMAGLAFAESLNIETVEVGNPGNAGKTYTYFESFDGGFYSNTTSHGAVGYNYQIAKYEVTVGQYVAFLNAVAKTDSHGLYNPRMDHGYWNQNLSTPSDFRGCGIIQSGTAGNYQYSVDPQHGDPNRPVNHVSFADAARFANWMHNGQPTGEQDNSTTEDGSYDMSATQQHYNPLWGSDNTPFLGNPNKQPVAEGESEAFWALNDSMLDITRQPGATWVLPTFNEWYKAAYHANGSTVEHVVLGGEDWNGQQWENLVYSDEYYDYATGSNDKPTAFAYPGSPDEPDSGNNATYDGSEFGPTTVVGEHESSVSPYGTYDQNGNVAEWSESLRSYWDGEEKYALGGHFVSDYAIGLTYDGMASQIPITESYAYGIRLAKVVPVPAAAWLGLPALALMMQKRRARRD
jgi:sulfatase modifying factor 1